MEFIQFSSPTCCKDDHDHGRQLQHFPSEPEPQKVGDVTGVAYLSKSWTKLTSELLISTLLCLDIQLVVHDVILLQLSCGFPKCSRSFEMKHGQFQAILPSTKDSHFKPLFRNFPTKIWAKWNKSSTPKCFQSNWSNHFTRVGLQREGHLLWKY